MVTVTPRLRPRGTTWSLEPRQARGSGRAFQGSGDLTNGDSLSEVQLRRLMGYGQDPNTGEQLVRPYRKFATAVERVQRRLEKLPEALTADERATQVGLIEAEEAAKPTGAPVAGFYLTFSVPKSVSTLWAVADGGTQALIATAYDHYDSRALHAAVTGLSEHYNTVLADDTTPNTRTSAHLQRLRVAR